MHKLTRYLSLLMLMPFLCLSILAFNSGKAQAATSTTLTVTAKSAYLVDTTTQTPLFTKKAFKRVEIASVTKVMTAIVVLKAGNLDQKVTIQQKYLDYVVENGASNAALVPGDQLTVRELLYGLMLPSGCDAAYALAKTVAGSYDGFVAKMNAEAKSLGLYNTYFTSVDGLHLPDQNNAYGYSTAYEVVRMGEVAMQNALFRDIVKSNTYTLPATDTHQQYTWSNTNQLLVSYEGAIGIKTGTTSQAGPCVLFAATRNGHTLIGVALNSADVNQRFTDATTMLDWGFQQIATGNYQPTEPIPTAA